jgi:hypothetical protein
MPARWPYDLTPEQRFRRVRYLRARISKCYGSWFVYCPATWSDTIFAGTFATQRFDTHADAVDYALAYFRRVNCDKIF